MPVECMIRMRKNHAWEGRAQSNLPSTQRDGVAGLQSISKRLATACNSRATTDHVLRSANVRNVRTSLGAFLLFFAVSFGAARCAAWFGGVVLVNWLYNFGPRLSSNYAPLDLFCPCCLPPPT